MEFRIADTFTDSLAKLTGDEQKAAKTAAFDLQLNPAHPSLQFHKLDKAKDPNFWSIRVGRDLRIVVHRTGMSLLLCYVILDTPATRRTGFVVNGEELSTILFSGYRTSQSMAFIGRQLFVMAGAGNPRRVASEDAIWPYLNLSVSPDGRYALVGAMVRHIPPEWVLYREPLLHQVIAARRPLGGISQTPTYLLLDTKAARLSPLLGAPKDWPDDGYLWLDGGRSLVVSHAYLPLDGVTVQEQASRESQPFVVEVALPSRRIARIGRDNLTATGWDAVDEEITLQGHGKDASIRKLYRRRDGEWEDVPISAASAGDLLLLPFPESRTRVREVRYPSQAEIIGRVTAVTMRIAAPREKPAGLTGRS